MDPLPPIPAAAVPPPPAGQPAQVKTIIQPVTKVSPPVPAGPSAPLTVFDQAPAATAAARQKAAALRQAAAGALRQLLTLKTQVEATLTEAKNNAPLTEALAGEGLSSKQLTELLKLAKPLLDTFTTPPPPAAS